jgi:hypothetical protein
MASTRYILGLDLGPPAEPTGLAVVERGSADGVSHFAVRHLVRFPPGTAFAVIAESVVAIVRDGGLGKPPVVCDITAVGSTILPVLRKAGVRRITPVVLTAALDAVEVDRTWRVPMRDLVTGLQVALQQRRLKVAPGLSDGDLFVRELSAFRATVTLDPNDSAPDWRTRPGDDLVLAVALAVWWGGRHPDYGPNAIRSGGGEALRALLDHLCPAARDPRQW